MPLAARLQLPPPRDDDEFEDLVTHALRARHKNEQLQDFGRSGQGQYGIDGWDAGDPQGLVWQSTAQQKNLIGKLQRDLGLFDAADFGGRATFIFAVAVPRDAKLQQAVMRLSAARLRTGRCSVEPLFWPDLLSYLPDEIVRRHYPERTPAEVSPAICQGLLALGWHVVADATLTEHRPNQWTMTIEKFVEGRPRP